MMEDLRALCALPGVSGREEPVREWIRSRLPADVRTYTDPIGNLYVEKKGRSIPKQKLMICAHMDEVGLIITHADEEGFLHFDEIGGIDPAVLIGRTVKLESGASGVIGLKHLHLCDKEEREKIPSFSDLMLDVGAADAEEAEKTARPGSYAVFTDEFVTFGDGYIKSKALDDRAGCAVMLDLIRSELPYDVTFVFTVQEEVGTIGAEAAAFRVQPDLALILETTTAGDICGVQGGKRACVLGKGPVISYMDRRTLYDMELYRLAFAEAGRLDILCQTKSIVAGGNDAGSVQKTAGGARVLAVSVPTRYLHSPVCVMDKADLLAAEDLVTALLPVFGHLA